MRFLSRRQFLRSACGMAAAFVAMNEVFGPVYQVSRAEAAEPETAAARADALSKQFIFDDQLHFVRDDYPFEGLLVLAKYAAEHGDVPKLVEIGGPALPALSR